MHDIKLIRENPELFDAGLKRRGLEALSSKVLESDKESRALQTEIQELQAKGNAIAKQIPETKKRGEDIAPLMEEGKQIKERVASIQGNVEAKEQALLEWLASIPNLPAENVATGKDEADNVEVRRVGTPAKFDFAPKLHDDLGVAMGLMDFEGAAKLSGSRFVVLKSELARLERALTNFMLDHNTQEYGYTEMVTPFLVKDAALFGTGQLPKFAEDLFKTTGEHYLIPTSEVPLTNLVGDSILSEEELPLRFTAYTPCFRSEAGSAGKDTRGMVRQHQFTKVELVSITTPEKSDEELERKTACAEGILKKLVLPFRTVALCTGDMGFSSRKTYDIEVWLPGQDTYREISSCSTCGDFQARRMKARYRPTGEKSTRFVHTLNGSSLALGRTIVAIMENYQQADGSVAVPDVLLPYMGGIKVIGAKA